MKTIVISFALVLVACTSAGAQVAPAATGGPGGITLSRNLSYAVRYSQAAQISSVTPTIQTSSLSGSMNYKNANERLPFSLDYGGGYTWTLTGPAYYSGLFQRLMLSQGIDWHKTKLHLNNDFSYLPESPIIGFSGVPGIGEPIGTPNPPSTTQSILSVNTHALENYSSGEIEHQIGYATIFDATGSADWLMYPKGDGLDTNSVTAIAVLTRRLSARNSVFGNYQFSRFSYPNFNLGFDTHTAQIGFRRAWTRRVATQISAGPSWIGNARNTSIPSSLNYSANAAVTYDLRSIAAALTYSHGTNGGAGYYFGGEVATVTGNLGRNFGPNFTVGIAGGYYRTTGLSNNGTVGAEFGGGQVTWRINRNFVAFANYTGMNQSSTSALPSNAVNELLQITGFGIGYSPRQRRSAQ
jgi:hypothetical protein